MTVNSYLTGIANMAVVRDREKESIRRSVATLQERLEQYFGEEVDNQFVFGSYSRGTILPRMMDDNSDVDYMIVFSDTGSRPQTYLNRLRRFVEKSYAFSQIRQSNPTIVLSLNHIRFELVPAFSGWFGGLQIPAKASDFNDWMSTDPTGFNEKVSRANKAHDYLIKPLIRVVKYWNSSNRYPFDSYALEQDIVGHSFGFHGLFRNYQLGELFFDYMQDISVDLFAPKWKREVVSRAQELVAEAKWQERHGYSLDAEETIRCLVPPLV